MSTSRSVAQAVAEAALDLDGSFEVAADGRPKMANVADLNEHRRARPAPKTLAECVPLLTIALQFVERGPSALTVEGVEEYRATAIRLLEHVRPVIEREAGVTLAAWAAKQVSQQEPT
jgi:hypothetical protein